MKPLACALLFLLLVPAANAVDALVLEVRELRLADIPIRNATVRLELLDDRNTRLTVTAGAVEVADPVGRLGDLRLTCENPVIAEPRYACDAGRLAGRGGPTGQLNMNLAASLESASGIIRFSGSHWAVAGTQARFAGSLDDKGWRVQGSTGITSVAALRKFAASWFELPPDITGDGKASVEVSAHDEGRGTFLDGTLKLADVSLTNEASTIVTDSMTAQARLRATLREADTDIDLSVSGQKGQVLVGPVLLDFGRNPMELAARSLLRGDLMTVESLTLKQDELLDFSGAGSVDLSGETPRVSGDFRIHRLQFPAGYTSYLQITLAASLLGDAETSGSLHGELAVRDNGILRLHVVPEAMELHDRKDRLHLSGLQGDLFWAPDGMGPPDKSRLSWASGGAYGLSGGAAQLEFIVQGLDFALTRPTKLPILDGALAIDRLAMSNLGADDMEVDFKGAVEPISMPRLARVFGWPQFQGTLAATIPGVTLKDNVLEFQGNVESQVFGGNIVGSNIRLQDPLGNFPQFFADVRARDLDLGLVTQTFEVGSITGKLEADVLNLQLFDWSPVAFDARLATPRGDKSRRRISARAVTSLSNVGGGGGGVVQALQGGVLRFFDEYSYEKLGITCRLRDDICEMSGVEPAGIGYYIVKGAGIPRIDIVGNAGRVSWSQLLSSISTADFGGATTQ